MSAVSRSALILTPLLVAPLMLFSAGSAQAAGDPEAGAKIFNQCKACHTDQKGVNKIGPSLYGVIGRKAGTAPNFNYSEAMKNAGFTWTPEQLEKYLTNPKAVVPGNKMAFPGLKSEQQREDVIAYLQKVASGGK